MNCISLLNRLGLLSGDCPDAVQRKVFGDAHTPGLPVLHLIHLLPPIPYPDKNLLYYILCFLLIAQKPKGKAKKLVLGR